MKNEMEFLKTCLLDELEMPFLLTKENNIFSIQVAKEEAKITTDVLSVLNYSVLTVMPFKKGTQITFN